MAFPRSTRTVALMSSLGLCAAIPATGAVQVVSATYGANCGATPDNARAALAAACDGQSGCDYVIDYRVLGDPVPGCAKTFEAKWVCSANGETHGASAAAEAGFGSHIALTCPADAADDRRSAVLAGRVDARALQAANADLLAQRGALETDNARLREQLRALAERMPTVESTPPCPTPPPHGDLSHFQGDGYEEGKGDSTQRRQFPAAPADNDLAAWLDWLNSGLREVLEQGMTYSELSELMTVENDRCHGLIYCQISLRREAVSYLVPRHQP